MNLRSIPLSAFSEKSQKVKFGHTDWHKKVGQKPCYTALLLDQFSPSILIHTHSDHDSLFTIMYI